MHYNQNMKKTSILFLTIGVIFLSSCSGSYSAEFLQEHRNEVQKNIDAGFITLQGNWQVWEDKMNKYEAGSTLEEISTDWDHIQNRYASIAASNSELIEITIREETFSNHVNRLNRYNKVLENAFAEGKNGFQSAVESENFPDAYYLIKITWVEANDAYSDFLVSARRYLQEVDELLVEF